MKETVTRKKVLFHYMIGGTAGGSDTCLYLLLKHLDQTKYDLYLLYKDRSRFVDDLESRGIALIQLPNTKGRSDNNKNDNTTKKRDKSGRLRTMLGGIKKIWKNRAVIKNLKEIIEEYKIDIVHTNHHLTGDRLMLIAAILKKKVTISHNRGLYPPDIIDKIVTKKIDEIICMSDFSKSVYTNNNISDKVCKTIYDGIEIEDQQTEELSDSLIKIGCFGRLETWKGQKTLIDAVELIIKTNQNIVVYFVGNGPDEEDLKKQVKDKGLANYIEFTGHIKNVKDYMKNCSIIVHTSIEPEPFGMVIIEAMALGKPVIATNFGGPVEIIENKVSGFLIPAEDPNVLANQILTLSEDKDLRYNIGLNARERIKQKFDVEKYARNIEQEYEHLSR